MVRLAPRQGVPEGSIVAFEAIQDGAIAFETGAAEMNRSGKSMLDLIGAKTADGSQHGVDGWDYLGAYPREMTGRVGVLAIHADWGGVDVPLDSIEKILTMMRDKLPDYPGGAQGHGSVAGDEDPCSLVSREEAESVLGKLLVRPYESRDLTGLVDDTGKGCSYYTKNHHIFSLMPMWSHAKAVFNVTGATRPIPSSTAGDWDKAASDPVGNFYFLKGDRMLAVSWKTSATDQDGALKIAALAMKKLSK